MTPRVSRRCGAIGLGLLIWATLPASPAQDPRPAPTALRFVLYKAEGGDFLWRLETTKDAKPLANQSEKYKQRKDARDAIDRILLGLGKGKLKFEAYEDPKMLYRWKLKETGGNVIAVSAVGYQDKADLDRAIELVQTEGPKARVDDKTDKP